RTEERIIVDLLRAIANRMASSQSGWSCSTARLCVIQSIVILPVTAPAYPALSHRISRFFVTVALGVKFIQGEDNQSRPDKGKRDQTFGGNGLAIRGGCQHKHQGRADILEEAEGGEAQMVSGLSKQQQRHGGDNP